MTNIEYVHIQCNITKIKNGRNDRRSKIFKILNGNLNLLLDLIHLYVYSRRNMLEIAKSIIKNMNKYFLFNQGILSRNTIIIDKKIKNIII